MENYIIDEKMYKDLIGEVNKDIIEKANKMVIDKKINITKVIYDDKNNFELHAIVKTQEEKSDIIVKENNNVYIKVREGEIQNLSCTCEGYKKSYCACEHIIAAVMEFVNNPDYIRIFAGNIEDNKEKTDKKENYSESYTIFNQLVKSFYRLNEEDDDGVENANIEGSIHIEPKIIYSKTNNSLKLEIKIGEKQFYKVKSLPEFYDRFINKEKYKYGSKLDFIHTREEFVEEDRKILEFVLKYAEIIKYANEASTGYDYYTKRLGEDAILVSNTGLDDLFNSLENRAVMMESQYGMESVIFIPQEPDVKFQLEEINSKEYRITSNIDIYAYTIYEGKKYTYLLLDRKLYKCTKRYNDTVIKLLEVFRKNFTKEIILPKEQLSNFFL